ncbi:hypothetical protein, partial [Escherichia coli]|uniref:hypothetical protein n=1 Tax=Escherichia coli TaxID=562 RepID=UPI00224409A9
AEGMELSESFQVACIIEKLPPAWKDFKNYLKHKRKEMSIEDIIVRLRIEEDNRRSEKRGLFQTALGPTWWRKRNPISQGPIWDPKEEFRRSRDSKGSAS